LQECTFEPSILQSKRYGDPDTTRDLDSFLGD
jgi:DNA repair exonuclease SbcCD ATPase subunit